MSAHLGIDFGTSHTVAVLRRQDGRVEALTFDGSPLMPSAVHAGSTVNVGLDALHAARSNPAAVEPHPKRRVDDGTVLLGEREFTVAELFAAVLSRVRERCVEVGRAVPSSVTITHPAAWGPTRRAVLRDAAARAGLPGARLLPEPVAAAAYYTGELGVDVPDGSAVAVHDFGGGTFDASVVRRVGDGFEVLAVDGLADLGGVDLDEALIRHLRSTLGTPAKWTRLLEGEDVATRRALAGFRADVRATKERLSRQTVAELYIPVVDVEAHLTREELESVVAPLLERAVTVTHAVLAEAAVPPEQRAGVFLVGGGSRMPLVATLLHRVLGAVPTLTDDVEQVVARGAILDPDAKRNPSRNPLPAKGREATTSGSDTAENRNRIPSPQPAAEDVNQSRNPHPVPLSPAAAPAPTTSPAAPIAVPPQPISPAPPPRAPLASASPGYSPPRPAPISASAPVYPAHPQAPVSGVPVSPTPLPGGPVQPGGVQGSDERPLSLRAAVPILVTQVALIVIGALILGEYMDELEEWTDGVALVTGSLSLVLITVGLSIRARIARVVAAYGQIGLGLLLGYAGGAAAEWARWGDDDREVMSALPFFIALAPALANLALLTAPSVAAWYRRGVPGKTPRRWPYWAVVFAVAVVTFLLATTRYDL